MTTVAQILRSKSDHSVCAIAPQASVLEAVKLMAERNIGALLVRDGESIVGIVTERDYARKVVLLARASKDTPVRDIMTKSVICVSPERTSEECMALMTDKRMRHLPVMDAGKLVGIVSIGDLVKDVIAEQKFIIEQLQQYIAG